jgi:hypothetical protein
VKRTLVPIRTPQELQKVLFIQQSVTQAAKNEMLALVIDAREPQKFLRDAKVLLKKYAEYPTLTEFAASPKLTNVYKWGATFGVTAVVGAFIIEECKTLHPKAAPALRRMLLLLLKELDQPRHKDFIAFLWGELRMGFAKASIPETVQMHRDLSNALESMVAMGAALGLMTRNGNKTSLTPVGKRILMHLVDTARFIDEMTKAHAKLQTKKK